MNILLEWTEPKSTHFLRRKLVEKQNLIDYFTRFSKFTIFIMIAFFIIGILAGHFSLVELVFICLIIGLIVITIMSICLYFGLNMKSLRIKLTDKSILVYSLGNQELEFPYNKIVEVEIRRGNYRGKQYRVLMLTKFNDAIFLSDDVDINQLKNILTEKNIGVINVG